MLYRYALSFGVPALLAGCGGSQLPIGAPGAMLQSRAGKEYTILHFFAHNAKSWSPETPLLYHNGMFYGTTSFPLGSVFSMTRMGHVKVLHSFGGGTGDGLTA